MKTRVLFIGLKPGSVDFSDPALPPGLSAAKIQAGIDAAMHDMQTRGWEAVACMVTPDDAGLAVVGDGLRSGPPYGCVVIGGGVRMPPRNLLLFERIVNLVHELAPTAAMAFNDRPENTAAAVARVIGDAR